MEQVREAEVDRGELSEAIGRFAGRRILVVGDIMLDEYLTGRVDRVSPEAPVPIVALAERSARPGGAANVALNVAAMGGEVSLVGLCGEDEGAGLLRAAFAEAGLGTDGLVVSRARRTTRKARVLAQGQQLLRVDSEDAFATQPGERVDVVERATRIARAFRPEVIVFEDYDKGCLDGESIAALLALAKGLGAQTVVDPKARNFWAYRGVDLLKPNLREASEACDRRAALAGPTDVARLAEELRARSGSARVLVTQGAEGAVLASPRHPRGLHGGARRLSVADVCGAGDSVAAAVALGLAAGVTDATLLRLANLAGGLACEYVGVRPVGAGDLVAGVRAIWISTDTD